MDTDNPLEFVTLRKGSHENYALFYSKRSTDMSICENGKGILDDTIHYGTTRFNKVRININTLQIIDNDFKFSHTVGRPQKFATGGDCYSNSGSCPQGDFYVNLEGTGFRIRPSMSWEASGTNSTIEYQIRVSWSSKSSMGNILKLGKISNNNYFLSQLEKPYQKVRARCGGYCGSCRPSSRGLFLEVLWNWKVNNFLKKKSKN